MRLKLCRNFTRTLTYTNQNDTEAQATTTTATTTTTISAISTRPKRDDARLVVKWSIKTTELGLQQEVPGEDTSAQGGQVSCYLAFILHLQCLRPRPPHFGCICIWLSLAFSGFRQTKFRQSDEIETKLRNIYRWSPKATKSHCAQRIDLPWICGTSP